MAAQKPNAGGSKRNAMGDCIDSFPLVQQLPFCSHYREVECMRQVMEELLHNFGVDVMFHGHVHAYERVNRMYNYKFDACGPVYIPVGDGGNGEKLALLHADDEGGCPDPMETPDRNLLT